MKNRYFMPLIISGMFSGSALAFPLYNCFTKQPNPGLKYEVTAITVDYENVKVSTSLNTTIVIPTSIAKLGDVKAENDAEENYFQAGATFDVEWMQHKKPVERGLYDSIPFLLTLEQDFTIEGSCQTMLEVSR